MMVAGNLCESVLGTAKGCVAAIIEKYPFRESDCTHTIGQLSILPYQL